MEKDQFTLIDLDTWPRKDHFDYYQTKVVCGYHLTVPMDVSHFLKEVKQRGLRFYPSFVWCVAHLVAETKEFCMGLDDGGRPGYFSCMHPNFTIFHEDDHTFSDVWTAYDPDFSTFYQNMVNDMETYRDKKGVKVKEGQPRNFFCISCVPWVSYSGFGTFSPGGKPNLFPIIDFGKYEEENGRWKMPVTVTISHAAADGYHTSQFFVKLQALLNAF